MRKAIDLTGNFFGKWEVLHRDLSPKDKKIRWICKCQCGEIQSVMSENLKSGGSTQCKTCANSERAITHGGRKTRLYAIWCNMKSRCYNSDIPQYKNYGGRQIEMCQEWKNDFATFRDWALNNGYEKHLTLDRKNNDLGYCGENCRWATEKQQSNNKRNNHYLTFGNETKTLSEWCEKFGISPKLVAGRLQKGWDIEKAFDKNKYDEIKITINEETLNLKQWCRKLNLSYPGVQARIKRGWTYEKALSVPIRKGKYNE